MEMVRKSGQMGVPVILVDDQVIIGFNQPVLDKVLETPPESQQSAS